MYAGRRQHPAKRGSSGRGFRTQLSPYRKDNRPNKTGGQFLKPVVPEEPTPAPAEPDTVYIADDAVEEKPAVAEEAYAYDDQEGYVEADCVGYDENLAGDAQEVVEAQEVENSEPNNIEQTDTENTIPIEAVTDPYRYNPTTPEKVVKKDAKTQKEKPQKQRSQEVRKPVKKTIDLDMLIREDETKFSGRSRLFVGNVTNMSEEDISELFGKYGETSEVYVNKDKGFGFVRLDYKINAELAKNALDGYHFKGRYIKVKFAANQSAIEVHGIDRFSSNESLEAAFSQFGKVTSARITCDERGKSKGYATIEFAHKRAAQVALQKINDGMFVLGRLPKPITAKPLTQLDDEGIHERDLERVPGILKDREYQARFIVPDTPEYEFAKKWKDLELSATQQKQALEKQLEEEKEKLEVEIETSIHESEADYIRQELLQRQAALEEEIRRYDEMRNSSSMSMRGGRANSHMQGGFNSRRNDEARRQDEFIKKHQQEIMRRHGAEDVMREMQNAAATVGMAGMNPAAALAMAAGGPASAAANILQAHAAATQALHGRGNPGMPRLPGGPRGPINHPVLMGPRGMMPHGGMRPMFDPGHGRGNMQAGARRHGPRDGSYSYKKPRTH